MVFHVLVIGVHHDARPVAGELRQVASRVVQRLHEMGLSRPLRALNYLCRCMLSSSPVCSSI